MNTCMLTHTCWHREPPRNSSAFLVLVWVSRLLDSKLKTWGAYWGHNPLAHRKKKHWNSLSRLKSSCISCGSGPQVQSSIFLWSCFPHISVLNIAKLVTSGSRVFMRRFISLGDHASCCMVNHVSIQHQQTYLSNVTGILVWTKRRSTSFFLFCLLV